MIKALRQVVKATQQTTLPGPGLEPVACIKEFGFIVDETKQTMVAGFVFDPIWGPHKRAPE